VEASASTRQIFFDRIQEIAMSSNSTIFAVALGVVAAAGGTACAGACTDGAAMSVIAMSAAPVTWPDSVCLEEWNFADMDRDGIVSGEEASLYFHHRPVPGYRAITRSAFIEACRNGTLGDRCGPPAAANLLCVGGARGRTLPR
jgi:hypothetical protein